MPDSFDPLEFIKARSLVYMSDELLIDMGHEPRPGYWERELAREISRRRIRARLRMARYRLITHPLRAARYDLGRRLMGDMYRGDDW